MKQKQTCRAYNFEGKQIQTCIPSRWNKNKHVGPIILRGTNTNLYTFEAKQIQTCTLLRLNEYKYLYFWGKTKNKPVYLLGEINTKMYTLFNVKQNNINMYIFDVKQIQACILFSWNKYKHVYFIWCETNINMNAF